jgi:hypothetical protein
MYPNESLDENIVSDLLPRDTRKKSYGLGKAIVSHFSYSSYGQLEYLNKTKILAKYDKLSKDYFNSKT